MTLREQIRRIFHRHPDHPFDAEWKWAQRPDGKRKRLARFRALNAWALDRVHEFKANGWDPRKFWVAHKAYAKKVRWLKAHLPKPEDADHLTTFDGLTIPEWIAAILQEARNDGVVFHMISGYRTPEYSEQLCYAMCGAPSCPGRCAGRASNHAAPPSGTGVPYEGACDISPGYSALESWCRRKGKPLYGGGYALGSADLPHFSHTGR